MSATLSQLQLSQAKHKAAGGQFLGSVIGWRVNNTVRLDHSTLMQLANQSGVPSHLLPAAVKSSQAFRKAK